MDGDVLADPVSLSEASNLRETHQSLRIHIMHATHAPDGDWLFLDHPAGDPFSFRAKWRREPASMTQREVLRFFGKLPPQRSGSPPFPLTKGAASEMIDRIYYRDPTARELWENEKDRRGRAALESEFRESNDRGNDRNVVVPVLSGNMNTVRRFCNTCNAQRIFAKPKLSHILHLLLSIVTAGMWLGIWLILAFFRLFAPYRCSACGKARLF